jgi:hypothetical protein
MKFIKFKIVFLMLTVAAFNCLAQYDVSPAYLTASSPAEITEYSSIVDVSPFRDDVAISRQYRNFDEGTGFREIRYFTWNGILQAVSDPYSHDYSGYTKILYDPNEEEVVYALYTERITAHPYADPEPDAERHTFIRRFERSGATVTMSEKFEVCDNDNPSNFVIASNGDILVTNMADDGTVEMHTLAYFGGTFYMGSTWAISYGGEGKRNTSDYWSISMDIRDDVIIVGHNIGYYFSPERLRIKKIAYDTGTATISPIYNYNIEGKFLADGGGWYSGNVYEQLVAFKPNGDIMYVTHPNVYSSIITLNSMKPDGSNTVVRTDDGIAAKIITTDANQSFYAFYNTSFTWDISLYSEYNGLDHVFTPTVDNDIDNLALHSCRMTATGKLNSNEQYHQHFSCSDCDVLTAAGEFVDQYENREVLTFYGYSDVAIYCHSRDVMFDGSASSCETGYHLSVSPIDVSDWSTDPPLFDDWVCTDCTTPHNIRIEDYTGTLAYNQYYLLRLAVSDELGGWEEIYKLFRVEYCPEPKRGQVENNDGLEEQLEISIYPNPSKGDFRIITNSNELTTYQVVDATGKIIRSGEFQYSTQMEMNDVPAGVYFVKINSEYGESIEKLILQ